MLHGVWPEFLQSYNDVVNANRFLGPLLLLLYLGFINFILLSILIAIVEDAFATAQEDFRREREEDPALSREWFSQR